MEEWLRCVDTACDGARTSNAQSCVVMTKNSLCCSLDLRDCDLSKANSSDKIYRVFLTVYMISSQCAYFQANCEQSVLKYKTKD